MMKYGLTIARQFSEIDNSDATSTSVVLRLASSAATAAEGSQCSSSCSTVVVVNTSTGTSRMRRASATSSLELGYSHTAQNSAISSETASFPGAIYDRCKKTGKYTGKRMKEKFQFRKRLCPHSWSIVEPFLESPRTKLSLCIYFLLYPLDSHYCTNTCMEYKCHFIFYSLSQIKHGHVE